VWGLQGLPTVGLVQRLLLQQLLLLQGLLVKQQLLQRNLQAVAAAAGPLELSAGWIVAELPHHWMSVNQA
jgi:hypothetical protein